MGVCMCQSSYPSSATPIRACTGNEVSFRGLANLAFSRLPVVVNFVSVFAGHFANLLPQVTKDWVIADVRDFRGFTTQFTIQKMLCFPWGGLQAFDLFFKLSNRILQFFDTTGKGAKRFPNWDLFKEFKNV